MTAWKYLLNCPPVNPICLIYYANFHYISAAHDCRSRGLPAEPFVYAQPTISNEAQLEQLSSVAAGARYLKNKCSRSDLPSDDAIDRAAWNVGKREDGVILITPRSASAARKCISNCSRTVRRKPQNAASLIASWRHLLIAYAVNKMTK